MERIDNVNWAIHEIFNNFDDAKQWVEICGREKAINMFNRSTWCIIDCGLFNEKERHDLVTLKDILERRIA